MSAETLHASDAHRDRTLAHFPGLAPAWHVVSAHVGDGFLPQCSTYELGAAGPREVCTLAPTATAVPE